MRHTAHRCLQRVTQPYDSDSCGQCCVAMLARVSLSEVINALGSDSSTNTSKIREGLKKFGFKSAKRLEQFRGNEQYPSYKQLDFDAILKMVHRRRRNGSADWGGTYHWVVWDSKCGRTLDPQRPPYKIGPAHRITSYLRVWRPPQSK
jgi:hypothetical protein